jgi:hypothetical protein
MVSLSPKGRALIQAGRRALRATPADRERIEGALRARLGAEALPLEAPAAPAPATPHGLPLVAKVAATCLLGGAVVVALLPRASTPARLQPPPRQQTVEAPATQVPAKPDAHAAASPAIPAAPTASSASAAPTPSTAAPPVPSASATRPRDRLAQEVALLSRAMSALKAGQPAAALRALDVHQQRFPAGVLAEERRAAKAQALCLLGRVREGRAELSQLAPKSPAAALADQVCTSAPPAQKR